MGKLLSEETLESFHDSLDRVLAHDDFFDSFYKRFLSSSPEIAAKFAGIDLARVKRLVRDAFYLKMMASAGSAPAIARLHELAGRHAQLGITRGMHDQWLETLLEVVQEFDPRYDATVAQSWREVVRVGLDIMKDKAPA